MRRYLNAFLILTLLITLVTGHLFLTSDHKSGDLSISDLFLSARSPNYSKNQVLAQKYIGSNTTTPSKIAVSPSEAPLYGEKEEIKHKIQEIAENSVVDWRILYVLAKYESSLNPDASRINSYERSYGLYQINTKVHNVTPEQAKDIEFSTKWTIDYLLENGYTDEYVIVPLAKHQGSPKIPKVINRANKIYYEAQRIN